MEALHAEGLADDVLPLMTRELRKLPEDTRQALELAACMGERFQLASLATVREQTPAATAAALYPAMERGFLLPLDTDWWLAERGVKADVTYRFAHARVQQATYASIPEGTRAELHLRIGRLLLAHTPAEQMEEQALELAHQFNLGCAFIRDEAERCEVARLNLLAGRKAKARAAFDSALRFFSTGLSFLPGDAWTRHYPLCFDLHLEAMEAENLNSRTGPGEALCEFVLARVSDPLDQVKVYNTRIAFAWAEKDIHRAIEYSHKILELLGLELPTRLSPAEFDERLARVRQQMKGWSKEALLNLPPMTAPRWMATCNATMRLMPALFMNTGYSQELVSMEMMKLCLLHGNAREAPIFYSIYGATLANRLYDVDTGLLYSDAAMVLLERTGARHLKANVHMVRASYILHWKRHLRETLPLLREAILAALEAGDVEFIAYSAMSLSTHGFFAGQSLDELVRENARALELLDEWNLKVGLLAIRPVQQACFNLMGRSGNPTRLEGEAFDEEAELPAFQATGYNKGISRIYLLKTVLACYFRDAALAVAMSEAGEPYVHSHFGQLAYLEFNFHQSLALLSAYRGASEPERVRYLEKVAANQERMKRWAENAPMNSSHRYHLVEAERARVRGDSPAAAGYYEQAIAGARENLYWNEEALCHELEGEFFLSLGRNRLAHDSFREAAMAYGRWGATAKVADLEKRYPEAFERAPVEARSPLGSNRSVSGTEGQVLELATVSQAARALSGELLLDPLIERLMRSVLANTSAQRGLLVLAREGRLVITAEQRAELASTLRLSEPVEGTALLPAAIVHSVARTHESIVLEDALARGLFTQDAHVMERRLRSVSCAPLLHQGELVGILYLEDNSTTGAFTADRLDALRVLCSQAALALRNAFLFAQSEERGQALEQRVEERTRELQTKNEELGRAMAQLRDMQKQLMAQEKLVSLGSLTAGIAHELKNPLNFINNFAVLSAEFAQEMEEELAARPEWKGTEELEDVLAQLRQSVEKIQEHGGRATQIINGMLVHSRERLGTREPSKLNAVLEESVSLSHRAFRAREPDFQLELRTDYDPRVGEVELVVPEIRRVFINVVDNACHALRRKKELSKGAFTPRIEVSTRDLGETVRVRIRDNGTGIPRELRDKVFHPFFTTKSVGEGPGSDSRSATTSSWEAIRGVCAWSPWRGSSRR
ncbi:trifunctional serine/threonine-protein kinase/ATP-binding protein/sensor histidine kinase [Cystobacter fuscus]